MQRALTILSLAVAAPAAAQLQIYTPQSDLRLPVVWAGAWYAGSGMEPTEFFDVRLPPEQQPTTNTSGTFITVGEPNDTSSVPGSLFIGSARDEPNPDIAFLAPGEVQITGGFLCGYNIQITETVPVSFQPGEAVGPNAIEVYPLLGVSNLHDSPNTCDSSGNIEPVGDGFTLGLAIEEPDGIHYGWITFARDGQLAGDWVYPRFRVLQYAYELQPGVPAAIPEPCPADTNGDGLVTPADFNAWIAAFNNQTLACDQNGDGLCTPADFNAWIVNFNNGC